VAALVRSPAPALTSDATNSGWSTTKEKAGFWTRRSTFVQVRCGSNVQLFPYPLVPLIVRAFGRYMAFVVASCRQPFR
jgi:hypothetical protein